MKLKALLASALAALGVQAYAANVEVTGKITASTTWTSGNTYTLNGYVFVTSGATLTIEPGTIVKGSLSSGTGAAALVICRGAKIQAVGTASNPIIFTSELDELNGNLTAADTGLWGGLVILGNASINSRSDGVIVAAPIQDQVEGFSVTGSDTDLITFGGTDDADNSGTIKYVSIRHGGAVIGTANEINGLTLGGVGSGTTIEYVEIFANQDDGIEFFGGTVSPRYVVAAFGKDDAFDFDQGYRGSPQFLFAILDKDGDKGIEWDGATKPLTATPKGAVSVANVTIVGAGADSSSSSYALNIRDAVEAHVYNSVFMNFQKMVDFEDDVDDGPNAVPELKNNIFFSHVAANNTAAGLNARPTGTVDATAILSDATNSIIDPALRGVAYTATRGLDPRPSAASPALTGAATLGSSFVATDYRGAFKDTNWAAGWTKLWTDGWFDLNSVGDETVPIVTDSANKFVNIATRGFVGTGDQVLIAGFIIPEGQTQTVLVRAVGPGLAAVAPTLASQLIADPTFTLYKNGTAVATVDNWSGDQVADVSAQIGAFALTAGSTDASALFNLEPGAYTVIVNGKDSSSGIALVEVYEVD